MGVGEKVYRFGEFRLDAVKRTLERSGETVHIETRVFELLLYLVTQRGRTVSRGELTAALWGDVKVSDGSLRRTVSLLRKALDARGPSGTTLETVHGRGYRFAAEVAETDGAAPIRSTGRSAVSSPETHGGKAPVREAAAVGGAGREPGYLGAQLASSL